MNSREFGLGLRLYHHSDKPLADWERTLLLSTGEWDELRSGWVTYPEFEVGVTWANTCFRLRLQALLTVSQLETLQLSKPESEFLSSGFGTPLKMLSVGLVMVARVRAFR